MTRFFLYRSAHLIAQYRPRAVIMTVTRNLKTARQTHLYRGCCPVYVAGKLFFFKNLLNFFSSFHLYFQHKEVSYIQND